jgi:membrane protease subunit HflC
MSTSDFERAFGASQPPEEPPRRRGGRRDERPRPNVARILALVFAAAVVLLFLLMVATGQGGFVEVQDTEAAVIVNYLTGERVTVNTPGYQIFLPFLQQAFVFDKTPQQFLMEGERDRDSNHVEKLTVRAADGSNFWFDRMEIQYHLIPERADFVLSDSGAGDAFKVNWVRSFARSILRDEFGRFSAVEVADPTVYKGATLVAEERLNALLEPHGVHIIKIVTPRPKFEANYEQAIEDRKVADQEVEKLKIQAEQLIQERERRLAQIESRRSVDFERLKGKLEATRIEAEREQVRIELSADAYAKATVGEGTARRAAAVEEARGLREKAQKEAEGLRAITAALEQGGEVLVREQLAEMLTRIRFTLVPYSRDPAPTRVELLDDGTVLQGGQ